MDRFSTPGHDYFQDFKALESRSLPSREVIGLDKDLFAQQGYLILKDIYDASSLDSLASYIDKRVEQQSKDGSIILPPGADGMCVYRGELMNDPLFREIIFDRQLIKVAETLLGEGLVYYGDSSIHFGNRENPNYSNEGWHRDCRSKFSDPDQQDWIGEYDLIRFGIYFQDYAINSGGLSIVPGSHNDQTIEMPKVPLNTRKGDLIVWNQRILHVGHTHCEDFGVQEQRIAIFASFAKPGNHLENYLSFMGQDKGWMGKGVITDRWKNTVVDEELKALLTERKLTLHSPIPGYGNL